MITYLLLGLVGLAVALAGVMAHINWLVPIGVATIFGAFFWFVRGRQGTPIMTKEGGGQQ